MRSNKSVLSSLTWNYKKIKPFILYTQLHLTGVYKHYTKIKGPESPKLPLYPELAVENCLQKIANREPVVASTFELNPAKLVKQ